MIEGNLRPWLIYTGDETRPFSPLLAGVALVPEAGMAFIGSMVSGRVMARTGPRLPMLLGLVLGSVGLLGLAAVAAHGSYWQLMAPLMATGFGMSLTMPAATSAVMEAAPPERSGLASGTVNAARQVGGVIGVALLGSLIAHRSGFLPGLQTDMVIAGGVFLVAAALTVLFVERTHAARMPSESPRPSSGKTTPPLTTPTDQHD